MTEERKVEIYAQLVKKAETATADGKPYTRFRMLDVLDELGVELNGESVALVEKLYADGFVTE